MRGLAMAGLLASLVGPAQDVRALDCSSPAGPIDLSICADVDLRAQEVAIEEALTRVAARLDDVHRDMLAANQAEWHDRRDTCSTFGVSGYRVTAPSETTECIRARNGRRLQVLGAGKAAGEGGGVDFAVAVHVHFDGNRGVAISMIGPQLAGAAAVAFPDLDWHLREVITTKRIDEAADVEPGKDGVLHLNVSGWVSYSSDHLISIVYDGFEDVGGTMDPAIAFVVNYLPARKRPLTLDDLIDGPALDRLGDLCADRLAAVRTARRGAFEFSSVSRQMVRWNIMSVDLWSFDTEGAHIRYGRDDIDPSWREVYQCDLSWEELPRLLRPGSPIFGK